MEYNKSSWCVMPLLQINPSTFGDNFINSFITRDGTWLAVGVKTLKNIPAEVMSAHRLKLIMKRGYNVMLWFKIPDKWKYDVLKFAGGKYSHLSEEAKSMIKTYSGLAYRSMDHEGYQMYTDYRLCIIDNDPGYRQQVEDELAVELPRDVDPLSPPGPEEFIVFQLHT